MINSNDVNSLQQRKVELKKKLYSLSGKASLDEINEIKSEIKYIDKQISAKMGSNELNRLEELKESSVIERNRNRYYSLKGKYGKIKKLKVSTDRMIELAAKLTGSLSYEGKKVKVM